MKVGGLRRLYIPGPVSSLNSPMSTNIMQEKMKDVVNLGPDNCSHCYGIIFPLLAQRFERRVIIWFFVFFLIWTASISEGPYFSSWKAKSGSKQPSYVRRQLIVHTRSWWWVKACIGIYIYIYILFWFSTSFTRRMMKQMIYHTVYRSRGTINSFRL